jgi:enamine deaminase RidA (YjgF/YER057c/UK114 family)
MLVAWTANGRINALLAGATTSSDRIERRERDSRDANADDSAHFPATPSLCTHWERDMMVTEAKERIVDHDASQAGSAEQRLQDLGVTLPTPPAPLGAYVEAVQTGNLLFLSGMLPTAHHEAHYVGRVGAELDVEAGRKAARLAALNALAVARQHLGSLDKVTRIVRLGVAVATVGDVRDHPAVADGASELLQDIFGEDKSPCRLVYGVASLPLGAPIELEVIFEVVG